VPAWFPLSGPVPWPGTAIPPAVADDGAGPAPGEPAGFVAVGRLTTGLGQIGIGALVVSGPDPVNPGYWITGLIPIWIAPPEVVAVLEEYHSDSRACFDNPCFDYGIELDDELKSA